MPTDVYDMYSDAMLRAYRTGTHDYIRHVIDLSKQPIISHQFIQDRICNLDDAECIMRLIAEYNHDKKVIKEIGDFAANRTALKVVAKLIELYEFKPSMRSLSNLIWEDLRHQTNIIIYRIMKHDILIRGKLKLPYNVVRLAAARSEQLFEYIVEHNLATENTMSMSINVVDTYDKLERMIKLGAKVDKYGVYNFIKAMNFPNFKIMKLLVDNGVSIYADRGTIIRRAINMHSYEILDWLFNHGLDPNYKNGIVLVWAMSCCYSRYLPSEMVKYLVEKGANPDIILEKHRRITKHSWFTKKQLVQMHADLTTVVDPYE